MIQLTVSPGFYEITYLADELLTDCICSELFMDTLVDVQCGLTPGL